MKRFFSYEVVFSGKLTPSVSPPFSKSENEGREPGFLSPKFRFLEFGGGRRGSFIDS
jgi:hypothetical protein